MLTEILILFLSFSSIFSLETKSERIIGGDLASGGQFPYAVAFTYTTNGATHLCGGSLLSNSWILTAAHCIVNITQFTVYLGSNSLTQSTNVVLNATESIPHPNYNSNGLINNIGLIKLPTNVTFTNTIKSISLPKQQLGDSQNVTVVGWGALNNSSSFANVTYHVTLTTITNPQCAQIFGWVVTSNVVCARGPSNEGTCRGDSGGPLVHTNLTDGSVTLAGVASFHSGVGCEENHPSGFTRTFQYVEWIRNMTGITNNSYKTKINLTLIVISLTGLLFSMNR